MEYRGIQYDIKQGIERDQWAWVVHTPKPKEGRIIGFRDEAVSAAIRFIEEWCKRHPALTVNRGDTISRGRAREVQEAWLEDSRALQ